MGQGLSCREEHQCIMISALKAGRLKLTIGPNRAFPLHEAATNGQIEVLSTLLGRLFNPDVLNRHKQTPLMLAAMHGKVACVQKLIQSGANILMFDSLHGRTCLHYAAYYGHSDCLQAILSAAHSTPVSDSWGYARFVNVRDGRGATPLHLAARQCHPACVHVLLDNEALVGASTGGYGNRGSTALHLAARGGSLDCVREILARGANRLQEDSNGRIPYDAAIKHKHGVCAALLNPSSLAPLVWPSPLKFIRELDLETKVLLERALLEANKQREKAILKEIETKDSNLSSPMHPDPDLNDNASLASDTELCCICFERVCTIEVQECGHQMCAHCALALCCHKNKPNPAAACAMVPVCPFCRSSISQLVLASVKTGGDIECQMSPSKQTWPTTKSQNLSEPEGGCSLKNLSETGTLRMDMRSPGKIAAEKP